MGRLGITYEQVAKAAEHLLASGTPPTVERIRRELGDTGSNSNIARHLKEWKEECLKVAVVPQSAKGEIPERLQATLLELWQNLRVESQAQNEQFQRERLEEVKTLQQEMEALQKEKETLKEALDKRELQINHLKTDLQLSQGQLIEEKKERAVVAERAKLNEETFLKFQAELEARLKETKKLYEGNIQDLKQQLSQYHRDLSGYKDLIETQRHKFIVEIDQARTVKEKVEQQIIKIQSELKEALSSIQAKDEKLRLLNVDFKVLQQESIELQHTHAIFEKQFIQKDSECKTKDELIHELKSVIASFKNHKMKKEKHKAISNE